MRYWVQFLEHPLKAPNYSTRDETKLIDASGDSAVFILDGRNSWETMRSDAFKRAQCLQHWKRYPAFQIVKGARLFDENKRSAVHSITYPVRA